MSTSAASQRNSKLRERKAAEEFETWSKEVRGRAFVEMRRAALTCLSCAIDSQSIIKRHRLKMGGGVLFF